MRFTFAIVFGGALLQSFVVDRYPTAAAFDPVLLTKMANILMSERALNDSPTCTLMVTYYTYINHIVYKHTYLPVIYLFSIFIIVCTIVVARAIESLS